MTANNDDEAAAQSRMAALHGAGEAARPLGRDHGMDTDSEALEVVRATAERDAELTKLLAERNRADAAERERDEWREKYERATTHSRSAGNAVLNAALTAQRDAESRLAALVALVRSYVIAEAAWRRCCGPDDEIAALDRVAASAFDAVNGAISDLDAARRAHDERVAARARREGVYDTCEAIGAASSKVMSSEGLAIEQAIKHVAAAREEGRVEGRKQMGDVSDEALASARSSALEELYAHVDGMRTAELNEPKRFPTLVLDDVLRAIRALITTKPTKAEAGGE